MDVREKLIDLIMRRMGWEIRPGAEHKIMIHADLDALVDALVAGGVTVKEMQKPLNFEELMLRPDGVWYENDMVIVPMMVTHQQNFSIIIRENVVYGLYRGIVLHDFNVIELPVTGYGKTWRCWAEKPTDEERKAAEWEK